MKRTEKGLRPQPTKIRQRILYASGWRPPAIVAAPLRRVAAAPAEVMKGLSPCLSPGHALLHLAREVRKNAEDTFDQHQLPAMMHFMFFHGHRHIESGALRR